MSKRRRRPNKTERTAAALLAIRRGDAWLIPEPLRSTGSAEQIVASVDWHHNVPHAIGGTTAPQNLVPLPPAEHDIETAGRTIPTIARAKRIEAKWVAFCAKMAGKAGQRTSAPAASRSRAPMPGSRDHPSRLRRRMNGKVEKWIER